MFCSKCFTWKSIYSYTKLSTYMGPVVGVQGKRGYLCLSPNECPGENLVVLVGVHRIPGKCGYPWTGLDLL